MQILPIHCNYGTLPWQPFFGFLYLRCRLVPPDEYDWTVHVRRRCGLMSNVPIRVTLPWERCRCTLRGQSPSPYELLVTITHTHTTVLRPSGARRELLDFIVHGKINRGRHTDYPAGHHSIRTNRCPPPPSPNGGGGHWNRKPKSGNNKSGQNCPNTWQ